MKNQFINRSETRIRIISKQLKSQIDYHLFLNIECNFIFILKSKGIGIEFDYNFNNSFVPKLSSDWFAFNTQ